MKSDSQHPGDIDGYIAGFPREIQSILKWIRIAIKKAAPKAQEAIKYKMPTFVLEGNLIHFAVHKKYISIYPRPHGTAAFRKGMAPYEGSKDSFHFPLDKPIPYALIDQTVKFRVAEFTKRAKAGKKPKEKGN